MRFEWDEEKNRANIRKHKIAFEDVPKVFKSPVLLDLDDREDYGEDRWVGIGVLHSGIIVVVFTERQAAVIRIISARKANQHERNRYEEFIAY